LFRSLINITLIVSTAGTARRITGKVKSTVCSEIFVEAIMVAVTKKNPSTYAPVLPRKILAGYALNLRNPRRAPIRLDDRTRRNLFPVLNPTRKVTKMTIKENPLTRPSSPSRRLIELITPTTKRIRKR